MIRQAEISVDEKSLGPKDLNLLYLSIGPQSRGGAENAKSV